MLLALLTLASLNLCRSQIFEVPCKTDVVYGAGGQEFVWMGNWALSKPLCFDKNYFLKSRNCKNGNWSPLYGICYGFKCPDSFIQNISTCIYHTDPVVYNTPCPDPAKLLGKPTTVPDVSWHSQINSTVCQIVDRNILNATLCNRKHSKQCSYSHKLMSGLKSNDSNEVEVALNFDAGKRQMFLIVYEVRKLPAVSIQCYTNGELNVRTVKTVKTFDSRKDNRYVRNFVVYELQLGAPRNQYWCHVFVSRSIAPINTQKVIGYTEINAPQYSAIIPLEKFCASNNCTREALADRIKRYICLTRCALVQIDDFDPDLNKGTLIMHVTTDSEEVLRRLGETFKYNLLEFADIRSNEFCPFESETIGDKIVNWDRAPLSMTATPRELCFDSNGTLVVRKCAGDFIYGARWEDPSGRCSQRDLPTNTKKLHELLKGNISDTIVDVTEITSDSAKLNVADVNLVAEILPKIETNEASFAKIVNNVMKAKGDVLREAQVLLNATDRILCSVETYYNEKNPIDATESHFIVRILKPFVDNATGLALYKRTNDFTHYDQVKIHRHQTFDDVNKVGLELAFYLPETLLQSMAAKHEGRLEEINVVAKIFYDDSLLKEQKKKNLVGSRVVAVSIPGFGVYLEAPVYLLFRPLGDVEGANCGFWDYGAEKKGWWSTTGQNHFKRRDDSLMECSFSHNTPYAILVTRLTKLFEHEWVLDLLTYLGSGISFIGIMGIFVTALLFKAWRGKVGTKILLQLSLLIALELIFTQLSGLQALYKQTESCRVVGVFLHYVVLAKFTWMLAVAYLQYKKFVKVIGSLPPRLLLKSSVFGWLSPLVIIIPTVLISLRDYNSGMMMFCYPYDIVFYVGLYAPFVLVISANVVIFYKIMANISNSESKRYSDENFTKRTTILQVKQAILFVFLFGITWTFGLMADVTHGWVKLTFVYLFCLTAPLQGFILFIFYVVLDRETKYHWMTFFRKK